MPETISEYRNAKQQSEQSSTDTVDIKFHKSSRIKKCLPTGKLKVVGVKVAQRL